MTSEKCMLWAVFCFYLRPSLHIIPVSQTTFHHHQTPPSQVSQTGVQTEISPSLSSSPISDNDKMVDKKYVNKWKLLLKKRCSGFLKTPDMLETVYSSVEDSED